MLFLNVIFSKFDIPFFSMLPLNFLTALLPHLRIVLHIESLRGLVIIVYVYLINAYLHRAQSTHHIAIHGMGIVYIFN